MEFSIDKHPILAWGVVSFPTPGDLPNPGSNPCLLLLLHYEADWPVAPSGKVHLCCQVAKFHSFLGLSNISLCVCVCVCVRARAHVRMHTLSHFSHAQLFATLWTVACQAPLSMGTLQARILEGVIMPSSRGSSQPRDWTYVSCGSCIAGGFFTAESLYTHILWNIHVYELTYITYIYIASLVPQLVKNLPAVQET